MKTSKRLTNAYNHAKVEYFDEHSKYVFFSDCHRGDDSMSDEFTRNQTIMVCALEYYYRNGFTYVEVGDGDELWEYINIKFIRSAHTDVFTVMKKFFNENRMTILYGNHNMFLKNKAYVVNNYYYFFDEYKGEVNELFYGLKPLEALVLKYKKTGQEILIVHGHQGDLMNDQLWFVNLLLLRYFWRFMHIVGFRNPASPAKNMHKRHKIEINYSKWIKQSRKMLICGHTHRFKFPKKGQLPYFNSGCCIHTKGVTCIEINEGKIMLVQWRTKADEGGVLRVIRYVLRGPEPIESYLKF